VAAGYATNGYFGQGGHGSNMGTAAAYTGISINAAVTNIGI
jgi:hypothetical protein